MHEGKEEEEENRIERRKVKRTMNKIEIFMLGFPDLVNGKHRLQLSQILQDSPGFLEFVPGPRMLCKLSRKRPYMQVPSLPRKSQRKCSNYTIP